MITILTVIKEDTNYMQTLITYNLLSSKENLWFLPNKIFKKYKNRLSISMNSYVYKKVDLKFKLHSWFPSLYI